VFCQDLHTDPHFSLFPLKAFYAKLREKGKPAKVALTAVMRKLLILLNSIARNVLYNHEEKLPISA
jgi:transposase